MKLTPLFDFEFHYTWLDYVDFGSGGQYVGEIEGTAKGQRLSGTLKLVNAPPKRPDNINCPTVKGVLSTEDGAKVFVEMNGIALLRAEDKARVFTTSLGLRSGDSRYAWVNTVFGLVEGVLDSNMAKAEARAYLCENDLAAMPT